MAELTKIGPAHLRREAWIYVRQSTMTQVRENTESLNRQYELVERAHGLGWPADRVRVVDEDLGCSGAEATARAGFQGLVAAVGLGQVGLVLGIEVSRLSRTDPAGDTSRRCGAPTGTPRCPTPGRRGRAV